MPPIYRIRITPAARRQLDRLPAPVQVRLRIATRALADNPRPPGAALIAGSGTVRVWRIRVGDYRVLYEIHEDQLFVLVVRAGHRRDIYRGRRISEASVPYESLTDRAQPHGGRSWTREALAVKVINHYGDEVMKVLDLARPPGGSSSQTTIAHAQADADRAEIRRLVHMSDREREAFFIASNRNMLRLFADAQSDPS